jgi:hypothetical protein
LQGTIVVKTPELLSLSSAPRRKPRKPWFNKRNMITRASCESSDCSSPSHCLLG